MRGYHQNMKEKEVLQMLNDRSSAYFTFDLAMKVSVWKNLHILIKLEYSFQWLPRKFREPMDAWFAQRVSSYIYI